MLTIKDSVAVITGAASGIGAAVAKYWAAQGGRLVLGDIAADALAAVEKDLQQTGAAVVARACDVTREADNTALAQLAIERFGAIHLVVPCAGIIRDGLFLSVDPKRGKVKRKMSLEQFQAVLDVNLSGVFLTVRECTEQMISHQCRGLVCLISSIGSLGTAGQLNYSASKAAVAVLPKVICAEFFRRNVAGQIRCVAVAPGFVATPMVKGMNQKALAEILADVPIQRLIEPEEVASLIGELYRNEALTGDVYYIHGGLRLGPRG